MMCVQNPDEVYETEINGQHIRYQEYGRKRKVTIWDEIFIGQQPPWNWTYRKWSRGGKLQRGELLAIVKGFGESYRDLLAAQEEPEIEVNPLDEWFD